MSALLRHLEEKCAASRAFLDAMVMSRLGKVRRELKRTSEYLAVPVESLFVLVGPTAEKGIAVKCAPLSVGRTWRPVPMGLELDQPVPPGLELVFAFTNHGFSATRVVCIAEEPSQP